MRTWIKNNFWLFFFGIFAITGTAMGIMAAVAWLNSSTLVRNGIQTEGRVVRLVYTDGGSAKPVIEYQTLSGQIHTYEATFSSQPPVYQTGETVTLWYNPGPPYRVVMSGLDRWLVPTIFGGFFIVFGGIGYGGLVFQWWRRLQKKRLFENGHRVEAQVVQIDRKTSVRANGVSPFVVICQWHDPGANRVFTFESDYIWYDPSQFITNDQISVLIDPNNPANYQVDLSFLPEAAN